MSRSRPLFGPAGNPEAFYADGHKHTVQMMPWLAKMGLDAYEYQCGRGVNVGEATAKAIGEAARENGVTLSLHAPYYISLASPDPQKRANSVTYIMQSLEAARNMGAGRIVVHSGSVTGMSREQALELATATLREAIAQADGAGLGDIALCPETMGKMNALGDLDEVLELCRLDERMLPTVDFGHLNARTQGGLKTAADFERVFDAIEGALGAYRMRLMHIHFSKIEYTKGGEKRHLTFEDTVYGPDFEPAAELMYKKSCTPTVICESAGTQAADALAMKRMYNNIAEG